MKHILTSAIAILFALFNASAQLEIAGTGAEIVFDFTGFAGSGFDFSGTAGHLDADTWAIIGMSDGDKDFGVEATTGDFARGSTMGGVSTGGIYAVDILGNQGIMVQPIESDFTPGSIRLKIWNNTGVTLGALDVTYTVYAYNDQGRSNSFNFAHSADNVSYIDEPTLNFTSGEAATFMPETATKNILLSGLNIADGDYYYLKWEGNDVGGSGSRDEFALDDILITAYEAVPAAIMQFASVIISEEEGATINLLVDLSESADCTAEIHIAPETTSTEGSDFIFSDPTIVSFATGGTTLEIIPLTTLDDAIIETTETIVLVLENISAGCILGPAATFTLTLFDNDAPTPTLSTIAEVSTEDINGIAESIGEYVQVAGIVYGINLSDDGGLDFTIIDETAGIRVFNVGNNLGYTVVEGDKISVIGVIDQFKGLTQIIPASVSIISTGNTLSASNTVLYLDENTESELITIDNVEYENIAEWSGDGSSFNVQVSYSTIVYTVRIDNSTDLASAVAPQGTDLWYLKITGLGSQFDPASPFNTGYQIMPRYSSDIEVVVYMAVDNPYANNIKIFPNPASDYFTVSGFHAVETVELINQLGETVLHTDLSGANDKIEIQNLIPGIYLAKIKTESGIFTSTICKM
ncbi:MAG: T9SS type A sorting domain-containing protein [Chitinophagales bacterium]